MIKRFLTAKGIYQHSKGTWSCIIRFIEMSSKLWKSQSFQNNSNHKQCFLARITVPPIHKTLVVFTGILFQLSILGNQITPFTFCPKSAQNWIWTPFGKRNLREILHIRETNVFGYKSGRKWNLVSFRKSIVKIIHLYTKC